MTGYRTRRTLNSMRQGWDSAFDERQADIARHSGVADSTEPSMDKDALAGMRMLTFAILFSLITVAGLLAIAFDDLVQWIAGGPAIVLRANP